MRVTLSYRILYSIIVMGSYARNCLIGTVVGLIGIGIFLALEQRWRNSGQARSARPRSRSARVQVKATSSEAAKNNTSSESLPPNVSRFKVYLVNLTFNS